MMMVMVIISILFVMLDAVRSNLTNDNELLVNVKIEENSFDSPTIRLTCSVSIPLGRVPLISIEMWHAYTNLSVKATNARSTDIRVCSRSIISRDLQQSPTYSWLAGMSEVTRLKRRYSRSYCKRKPGEFERELVVVIDDVKIYDLNRWICEVEPYEEDRQHVVTEFDGLIQYNPFKIYQKVKESTMLLPELAFSIHPIIFIGGENDEYKHMKASFTCALPGYNRDNLNVRKHMGSPFIYVSIGYEQETNLLGFESSVTYIQSELFTRHLLNEAFMSTDRLITTNKIDFLCKDPPSYYDRNPLLSHKFSSVAYFKGKNLPVPIQPSLERAPLTVCFNKDWKVSMSSSSHRSQTHPLESRDTCTDFFLFGDLEIKDAIAKGKNELNTDTMLNTFIYSGNLMEIGQLDTVDSNPELHLTGNYFTTINHMVMRGKDIEGPRRLVFKMPEQTDIKPIQVTNQNPYIHVDEGRSPARRVPLKIVPSGTLLKEYYKQVAKLYMDFAEVEAKRIHIWADLQYDVTLNCIGYNGGYARVIYIANGLCADNESPVPEGWCRPKGYE